MKWISVKDRMPDGNGCKFYPYLTIHSGRDFFARVLNFDSDELVFRSGVDDTQKVTHWMPLPNPPLEEQ